MIPETWCGGAVCVFIPQSSTFCIFTSYGSLCWSSTNTMTLGVSLMLCSLNSIKDMCEFLVFLSPPDRLVPARHSSKQSLRRLFLHFSSGAGSGRSSAGSMREASPASCCLYSINQVWWNTAVNTGGRASLSCLGDKEPCLW